MRVPDAFFFSSDRDRKSGGRGRGEGRKETPGMRQRERSDA